MRLEKHQKGMTFFGLAFILFLIGFTVFTALKLFPVYMQNFNVHGALQSIEEDHAAEYHGRADVLTAIVKRLDINNVDQVKREDISISRNGRTYIVDIDYEVRVPFIGNVSLIIAFENHAEVTAQ